MRIELADGSWHVAASLTAEPGFGFLTIVPYRDPDDEPRQLVVPIGAVKSIELSAPDPERPFGFTPVEYAARARV